MNDDLDDPKLHLELLWHALAERTEALFAELQHVNELLVHAGIFQPSVLLGPIIDAYAPGPPWLEAPDVVIQTAFHLPDGAGVIAWTVAELRSLKDPLLKQAAALERFRRYCDCNIAIKVRVFPHVPALFTAMDARLQQVADTGVCGTSV